MKTIGNDQSFFKYFEDKNIFFKTTKPIIDDYGKLEDTRQKEEIFFTAYKKQNFRCRNQITGCQEPAVGKWYRPHRDKRG